MDRISEVRPTISQDSTRVSNGGMGEEYRRQACLVRALMNPDRKSGINREELMRGAFARFGEDTVRSALVVHGRMTGEYQDSFGRNRILSPVDALGIYASNVIKMLERADTQRGKEELFGEFTTTMTALY